MLNEKIIPLFRVCPQWELNILFNPIQTMHSKSDFTETPPCNTNTILLHCCCAPCSTAIVEWMLLHNITPIFYFYNPNISPLYEYLKRKEECCRYATLQGVEFIDADYNHTEWLYAIKGFENSPERGERCNLCFRQRLLQTAHYAHRHNYSVFATTLASSRWKNITQVAEAGNYAASQVANVTFWNQNWRRNGLQDRRNSLIAEYNLYNQQYCGCEFSYRPEIELSDKQ